MATGFAYGWIDHNMKMQPLMFLTLSVAFWSSLYFTFSRGIPTELPIGFSLKKPSCKCLGCYWLFRKFLEDVKGQ
jgi:hypothetical protein